MIDLRDFLESKNWVDDVNTTWVPKKGLFTWKDPKKIAAYLLNHSKDEAQAMQRLNFYMNRAGDNLTNKTVLNQVKVLLSKEKMNENFDNSLDIYKPHAKTYANMICVNPNNEILVLRRSNYMKKYRSLWGFPGGSVENEDRSSKDAAMRELKEETGIEPSLSEQNKSLKKFDTIKNDDGSISDYWIIQLDDERNVKLSPEHRQYDWIDDRSEDLKHWMPDVFQLIQKYYIDEDKWQ